MLSSLVSLSSRRSFPGSSPVPAPPHPPRPVGRQRLPAASPTPRGLSLSFSLFSESRPGCLSTESIGPGRVEPSR